MKSTFLTIVFLVYTFIKFYSERQLGINQNYCEAMEDRMGIFKKKTPEEYIDEAYRLMDSGNPQKAADILKEYAQKGYVGAMLYYATCLTQIDTYHFNEATEWILKAKEAIDDPEIQEYGDDLLGIISDCVKDQFAMGEKANAEHRKKDALEWNTYAAQNNHLKAMYTLANLYYNDEVGIDKDIDSAIKWYTAAAKFGHVESMNKLAWIYFQGIDVRIDLKKAAYWYQKAADNGDFDAISMLELLNLNN